MWKPKILILFFATLFTFQCVETLISVKVFPNGEYLMRFRSEGDKKDIFNDDFVLPQENNWTAEAKEKQKPNNDETIFILETQALLKGKTIFHSKSEGPFPQRHPIHVKKIERFFSTTYKLNKVFKGRRVHQKYPLLAQAMANASTDSIYEQVESEIIMYCLKVAINQIEIEELLKERILNHFRGVFYKAEEEGTLLQVLSESKVINDEKFSLPEKLIRKNLVPFEMLLPSNFVDICIEKMKPYIKEANITVELHDDTFKFASVIPGLITKSNADSITNDTLWWNFNADDFLNDDYMIEAASVIYYPKRIQLTIVVIAAILLLILFIKYVQRRTT
ncbi:hypothetical protein OAD01_03875 [Candidatus Marinimicrobia bacterium]|jgi:hypothetical protein|nr:hypothetical protein [Candidatus Neomarinimicrobiota bacterium]|tara:strand:+ start:2276 stop:3280 length:1005 start_codon:yes stop_codon:yes gene_type:complete